MEDRNYKEALTEVSEILKYMPQESVDKLPKSVQKFIEENKSQEYVFAIDETLPFSEQNLKEETETFLAILTLKYWDKENRDELIRTYIENERKYQEELHERYRVDIFGQDRDEDQESFEEKKEETALVEYKEDNVFVKIFKNISRFIKDFFTDD